MNDMKMANHIDDMDAFVDQMPQPEPPERGEPCPACGMTTDYCSGHGEIGDPDGAFILQMHDEEIHEACHWQSLCRIDEQEPGY